MSYVNDGGRSPMQEGLDRSHADDCCQGHCSYPQQEQASEMPMEQDEQILFGQPSRRRMRFAVDLQDAFKP